MTAGGEPGQPTGRDVTVVIADDDTDIRDLVAIAARRSGATVCASVGDGALALQAIERIRPDLAVLDVSMPGMTGLEVCRQVRANPDLIGIRLLLLSASVHSVAIDDGMMAGADMYLEKPFAVKSLSARIRELLAPGGGS